MKYFVCDTAKSRYFQKLINSLGVDEADFSFIFKEEYLNTIHDEPGNLIIIDVTVKFSRQEYSNFAGFDIAIELRRRYKNKLPIIFHGQLPLSFFIELSKREAKIRFLFGRGSSYVPFGARMLEEFQNLFTDTVPLSKATLHDVVTMLCDLKGMVIDRLNHEIRFDYSPEKIDKVIASVLPYCSDYQIEKIQFIDHCIKLKDSIQLNNEKEFRTIKHTLMEHCALYLAQPDAVIESAKQPTYTILLVDDRKEDLKIYNNHFSKLFNTIPVDNALKAIKIIEKDTKNNISAIISDWRLFKDESLTFWQPLQGYEVLAFAARNGIRALFALTAQADFVIHQIRNILGIGFSTFKKDDLLIHNQWDFFSEQIMIACENVTNTISNIPKGAAWVKSEDGKASLSEQYRYKRNSPDWPNFEQTISQRCDTIWPYYQRYIERFSDDAFDESLQDFSVKFGIVLKNNLESILIARRICIGLYFHQGEIYNNILGKNYPRIDVYSVFRNKFFDDFLNENSDKSEAQLKGKSLEEYALDKMISASSGLLNTTLCLDVDLLAGKEGILPEERNWLIEKGFRLNLQLTNRMDEQTTSNANIQENIIERENEPSKKEIAEIERYLNENLEIDEEDNFN